MNGLDIIRCAKALRLWFKGKNRFGIPMIWHEQKIYTTDCFLKRKYLTLSLTQNESNPDFTSELKDLVRDLGLSKDSVELHIGFSVHMKKK